MSEPATPVNPTASGLWSALTTLIQQGALHQEAVAARLGLNPTDLRCVGFAWSEPDLTPGRLAELTGLTTGAVTGVLDRLERAGFVQRVADPTDRRRTLVRVSHARGEELGATYDPLERAVEAVVAQLDAATAITDFLRRTGDALHEDIARLRASTRGGMVGEMFIAPLGDADAGRLVFASGAPRLALRVAPLGPAADARMVAELAKSTLRLTSGAQPGELCRATFSGPVPTIRAIREGTVAARYPTRLDWRARHASIGLSPDVPWTIDIKGGLSGLSGDLRGIRLRSFDLRGGVDELELDLPAPDGTSRIHIAGSPANVTLLYPAGCGVRASIKGGIHELRFGSRHTRQVHGAIRLETPGVSTAPDRYEVEITGGVRDLRIMPA